MARALPTSGGQPDRKGSRFLARSRARSVGQARSVRRVSRVRSNGDLAVSGWNGIETDVGCRRPGNAYGARTVRGRVSSEPLGRLALGARDLGNVHAGFCDRGDPARRALRRAVMAGSGRRQRPPQQSDAGSQGQAEESFGRRAGTLAHLRSLTPRRGNPSIRHPAQGYARDIASRTVALLERGPLIRRAPAPPSSPACVSRGRRPAAW